MPNILIVDDLQSNRLVLRETLGKADAGYVLFEAESFAESLAILKGPVAIDLVLLDVMMPEVDGFEACRRLKADPSLCDIPVIFVTALDKSHSKVRGFEAGGVDYITKPFDPAEMKARVAAQLKFRKAETLLRESDKRFMDVLYAAKDAILLIAEDKFVDCNDATVKMLGYASKKEFLMKHPSELSPAEQPDGQNSLEKANQMIRVAFREGFHRFEWAHTKARGENFPVEVSLTPIVIHGKNVLHCLWRDKTKEKADEREIAAGKDILEKNAAELKAALGEERQSRAVLTNLLAENNLVREKLENSMTEVQKNQQMLLQAEKLASIGQLAAGIAHEINNPTGFIGSNLSTLDQYIGEITKLFRLMEMLKMAIEAGDLAKAQQIEQAVVALEKEIDISYILTDVDNLLRESKEGIARIANIVRDLKLFSHSQEDAFAPSSLCKILDGVVNIVWNEIKYKAELQKHYKADPVVPCNSQQIGQVFINLLVNAAQAIEGKGTITIRTYTDDRFAHVEVSDTGCGIPKENIHKIFDAFFTTKEPGKGTGLGLGITATIIRNTGASSTSKVRWASAQPL